MKKLLVILAGVVVLALAMTLVVPWFLDAGAYRSEIARRVAAATGRPVVIDGPIAIALLPSPRVRASEVRIGVAPGAESGAIDARHVDAAIGWSSLFGGEIELTRLRLVEPTLTAESPGPRWHDWHLLDLGGTATMNIEQLEIESGRAVWRDRAAGTSEAIEQIQASVAMSPLNGSVRATGTAVAAGVPLEFDIVVGDAPAGRPRTLSAALTVRPGLARATLRGIYVRANPADPPELRGRLQIEAGSLATVLGALAPGWSPGGALAALASQGFSATAELLWSGDRAFGRELAMQLGDVRATGGLTMRLAKVPVIDATLSMSWLDIDRLAQAPRPRAAADRGERTSASSGVVARLSGSPTPREQGLPRNLDGSLELTIEALGLHGGVVRQAKLNAALSRGEVVINQVSAQLPGGAELVASGQIARAEPAEAPQRLEGTLALQADNLRGLLTWLGVDMSAVRADRLRRFVGRAHVQGTLAQLEFTDLDLRFDSSQVTGGITVAPAPRPGLGIDLRLDQLNLDGYHGAAPAATNPPRHTGGAIALSPALLDAFDATLRLRAGTLTLGGEPLQDVTLEGTLQKGNLELRRLALGGLAGAQASATGHIGSVSAHPDAVLDVAVQASDASRLLRLLDLSPGSAHPSLDVTGRLTARAGEGIITLEDTALALGGARFSGQARYDGAAARLRLDLAADTLPLEALPTPMPGSGSAGLAVEVSLAAKAIVAGSQTLEAARLEARLESGEIAAATLTGTIHGGALTLAARGKPDGAGGMSGTLALTNADLRQALRAIAGTGPLSGVVDLQVAFTTASRVFGELRTGLAGKAELIGRGGAIAGLDLAAMRALMARNEPVDIVTLLGAGVGAGATPYRALSGTARIERGVIATEDFRIATALGDVTGRGGIDLYRQTLDAALAVPVAVADEVPPLRIALRGGFDDPHVALDFARLQAYLLRRYGIAGESP